VSLEYLAAAWIVVVSLYGVATSRNLIHMVVCLGLLHTGAVLFLMAVGFRRGARAPIFVEPDAPAVAVDPVLQALALTDIVIGATITALLLSLAVQVHRRRRTLDPAALRPLRE
jgi:multicomponent Na+:H+ antiporter subunit C